MHIFYTPDIQGVHYTLNEEESKHCIRVLRLKTGDLVLLVDGRGGAYSCEIIADDPKKCQVKVLSTSMGLGAHKYHLHLAIAPTKNMDRMEWFVEKATELGINEISLLLCERSERKEIKTERLEKIAVAAMKQSMKAYCPKINPLLRLNDFVKKDMEGLKMMAHCMEEEKPHFKNVYKVGHNAIVMIGPEGDFSPAEIKNAGIYGFQEIQLGTSRLRTETAGILVCAAVQVLNE